MFDAFISAVTSECGKARDAVAAELRKQGQLVAVQSDFPHGPASNTLLQNLHDAIRDSGAVHCIVGTRAGAYPPADAVAPFSDCLPPGIKEASYTQWEFFFALRYAPDRTWLYRCSDQYQPDQAVGADGDRSDLQQHFLDHIAACGYDFEPFSTVGDLRSEVLSHFVAHRLSAVTPPRPVEQREPFHRGVAINAIGSVIAGMMIPLLTSLVTLQIGQGLSLLLLAPAIILGCFCAVAFFMMYDRYKAILGRQDADARGAYDKLPHSLTEGGAAARIYAHRLRVALDWVDRLVGDAAETGRAAVPRVFGLRSSPPLWTASALDRCLLFALIYPVVSIMLIWVATGHVGAAERALLLNPIASSLQRYGALIAIISAVIAPFAIKMRSVSLFICSILIMVLGSTVGSGAFLGTAFGFNAAAVFAVSSIVFSSVLFVVLSEQRFVSVGIMIILVGPLYIMSIKYYTNIHVANIGAFLSVVAAYSATTMLTLYDAKNKYTLFIMSMILIIFITISLAMSYKLPLYPNWHIVGGLLLFFCFLTTLNAPFDWVAFGLTRFLLRRGLELGGWFPYMLAILDTIAAAVIILVLAIASVIGVQAFDDLAALSAGDRARILPIEPFLNGLANNPSAPEYWWAYAMLFSTMIPSLLNLMIGGSSLLRGVPWITSALLRAMPPQRAPSSFNQSCVAMLLTIQIFAGGLFGLLAQAILIYVFIGLIYPIFGLDILHLSQYIASIDLPLRFIRWINGTNILD